jgi:flavin-dependent dehydrogenase
VSWDFDVAIVGGGPAGTSTGLHLVRREGLPPSRVVLLEKALHPRDKPCAGAVSDWGLDALAMLGLSMEVPHVRMRALRVVGADRWAEHCGALGVVVRRAPFDASLWNAARRDGVVALDGEPLVALARCPGGFRLTTSKRVLSVRLLAACDGVSSLVRRLLGLRERSRRGHLYVLDGPATPAEDALRAGTCVFDLRVADSGVQGYVWSFPTPGGATPTVNRGIYHANRTPRRSLKRDLLDALGYQGIAPDGVRMRAYATRPYVPGAPLALWRAALVGEAAGIDATTGEGIAQAIVMGGIAARWLALAARTGEGNLDGYEDEVRRSRVGTRLAQSAWLSQRVYGPAGEPWRRWLAGDDRACEAGARWYAGEAIGWALKARLGLSLAAKLVSSL